MFEWLESCVTPPVPSNKPVYLAFPIGGILSVLVSLLVSLDGGAGAVVLVVIDNKWFVIVVVSSPVDYKGIGAIVVVSTAIDGYGSVLSVVVSDEGASAAAISSIVVLVDIIEIETIF